MEGKLFIFVGVLSCIALAESRQGWKTSGSGYFVYKASTPFKSTNKLEISGKFSTKANSQKDNVLIAAEDACGSLVFQYGVVRGQEKTTVRQEQLYRSSTNDIAGGTSGRLFSFKLIVRQIPSVDGEDYMHIVNSSLVIGRYTTDSRKWNLDNITLYIGGYKQSINSGQNFEGCLSDFMFQGVNIIEAYFQQYPNNTNPVRGRYTSGNFSNMAETCDDSGAVTPITTQPPTSARINGNSGAIGLKVFSFLFLFAFVFMFCVL